MATADIASAHHSSAPAGAWKLAPRQAMSLRPHEPGVLRVMRGRLWITCGTGQALAPQASGDHVLAAGQQLRLAPGTQAVLESCDRETVHFDWQPLAAAQALPLSHREAVRQSLAELRLAAGLACRALGRLAVQAVGRGPQPARTAADGGRA